MTITRRGLSVSKSTDRDNPTIVKPTEAQLRYAQFHHKRRAQAVKHKIDRLFQTPLDVVVTIGRLPPLSPTGTPIKSSDDDSIGSSVVTEETRDPELKAIRLLRPKISAGRRAFLKDSKRSYRRRRREIAKHGYRGYFLDDEVREEGEETDFVSDADEDHTDTELPNSQQQVPTISEEGEGAPIFATRPKHTRRRRRNHANKASSRTGSADKESYQRFQAACHAMMRNIQTSQTKASLPTIAAPTKRWRRSEAHVQAAKSYDFSRYKTSGFVAGRKTSGKNAALLLSYKYYQQNQKDFVMDKGASWLTHVPAKQSKRSQGNHYYFHDMNDLPHLIQQATSFDEASAAANSDGNESSSTLAMRGPGPQKFHRLMAYVQHKLIEKEKQLMLLDGDQARKLNDSGQSRTKELVEFHVAAVAASASQPEDATPTRIQQMAESIEGSSSKGTPTMKLKAGTPFSGISSATGGSAARRRRGKSRYVPRMRLREFVVEGSGIEEEGEGDAPTPLPRKKLTERFPAENETEGDGDVVDAERESPSTPRRMRLRDSIPGQETNEASPSRTREMALALEGDQNTPGSGERSKIQQIRDSLEPKNATPRMKLKDDFDRMEEKKASDEASPAVISRSTVGKLSQQFQSSPAEEVLEDFNRPSQDVVNEFSKHIDPRIYEQFQTEGSFGDQKDPRQSTGSNVTEFFARLRGEQQKLQQQGRSSTSPQGRSSTSPHRHPLESITHPMSPGGHSDAVSDLSKESNLSGFWNRGRHSISNLTSNLNTIAENHQTNKGKGGFLSPQVLGRATSGLLNKFRGVPEDSEDPSPFVHPESESMASGNFASPQNEQQSHQHDQNQDKSQVQQHDLTKPNKFVKSQSIDSQVEALRGYRQNRASMSPEALDNQSEASTYNPLPDQIREAVQNSGGRSPSSTKKNQPNFVSPNRSSVATQSTTLSPEDYKRAHDRFLENSQLLGGEFEHETIIDTDGTQSVASDVEGMDPQVLANLLMSPDILQKRLKQAINAIEKRKWDQVLFLINANPWLAEMKELTTNQFLLHKLAFFGMGSPPAPMSLSEQLVEKFPAAVHKFDQDGNVPLHLASAAGNVHMIKMLGEKFESGASIRNEDGMLPLHFAIASFSDFDGSRSSSTDGDDVSQPLAAIKTVLKLFPKAVAIADNDGNLPLHVASECLQGGVGADIIYLLMDEAERQLEDPYGARFRNKIKVEEMLDEDMSQGTMSTNNRNPDDSSVMDSELHCTMVLNDFDETPLLAAIRSYKGWEIIEALVSGPGGRKAALQQDSDQNNALHLLVGEFQDATAAMSILKIIPETALHRNAQGILPIELACMVMMPEEVILAIALVDLPINIDDRDGIKVFDDRGESWAFLTCDCDDHMAHVVEEIMSICSFQQLQELCFRKVSGSEEQTIIDKATPKCREAMNRALRFLGRFEFVGDGPLFSDLQTGFKAFDALDFGSNEEGKNVLLECYQNDFDFENRVYTMFEVDLDGRFVEEVNVYVEHQEGEKAPGDIEQTKDSQNQQQRCVAIERPRTTLNDVVQGMAKNGVYDSTDPDKRLKYSAKICSVLKLLARALRHLHEAGVVHGNVCKETCGKFEDSSWKLMERLDVQIIGNPFDPSRFRNSFPPDSLEALSAENDQQELEGGTVFDSDRPMVSFAKDIVADVSIDIWGFGKLCYESLVGKPLVDFDSKSSESPADDVVALLQTAEWNVSNMETVFADLLQSGIEESGADMITACLFPSPDERPVNMDEILDNPFWAEMRKHRSPRKNRGRRSGDSVSTSVSLLTDVDRYEV